jgi:hypothetical protein
VGGLVTGCFCVVVLCRVVGRGAPGRARSVSPQGSSVAGWLFSSSIIPAHSAMQAYCHVFHFLSLPHLVVPAAARC